MLKIFGTMGPSCFEEEIIQKMFEMDMTGMRLNLSHINLVDCKEWTHNFYQAAKKAGVFPELLIDMKGPELRLSRSLKCMQLEEGIVVNKDIFDFPEIIDSYLVENQKVWMDDGKIRLICLKNNQLKVQNGGLLKPGKSIALPGCDITPPGLTQEDYGNLAYAKECGVTGIMQPFVRSKEDLIIVRNALNENGLEDCKIYAKIENRVGVEQLESFLPYCDEIIIARGDLANSVGIENIASCQHYIEQVLKKYKFPYMVVTEMLNSMCDNKTPTRAEVSDIYHAVYNGASSIMLTAETAAGKYPIEAMYYFTSIAKTALKDKGQGTEI